MKLPKNFSKEEKNTPTRVIEASQRISSQWFEKSLPTPPKANVEKDKTKKKNVPTNASYDFLRNIRS